MGVYPWGARPSLKVHIQIIPFPSVFLLLPSPFIRMLSPALSPLLHPRYHSFDSDITTSLHLFSDRSPCLFFYSLKPMLYTTARIVFLKCDLTSSLSLSHQGFTSPAWHSLLNLFSFPALSPIPLLQEPLTSSRHRFPSPLLFTHVCPAMFHPSISAQDMTVLNSRGS